MGSVIVVVLALSLSSGALAATGDEQSSRLPRPAPLEAQVRFWRGIFAERSTREVVLHDAVDVERTYAVLDLRPHLVAGEGEAAVEGRLRRKTDAALARLRARLRRERGPRFDPKSVRAQRGMRERFVEGLRVSGRYLPEMERIFQAEGVPLELTRLPLIESSFDFRARSSVGAAGIWQFTRPTGRLFLRVDALVDERLDPIAATRAAAKFLRGLHDRLGTWPLAVTAYNHGPTGVARAVRELGTRDIGTIARRYRGRGFGFASRNFYAELLAALDVEGEAARHFGPLERDPPLRVREQRLVAPVTVRTAARRAGVEEAEVVRLNPALGPTVVAGRRPIPAGYRLRVPETETAAAGPAAEPPSPSPARPRATALVYRVRRGDTLSRIAHRHATTVAELRRLNGLQPRATLRVGQRLTVRDTAVGG